jgi:gluconolactonase
VVGHGLRTVAGGLDHPEGVCWAPEQSRLYAGGEAGQLYRFDLDGGRPEELATVEGGFLLGLALDAAGAVYACDAGNGRVQRMWAGGSFAPYGPPIGYPNYPAFDARGRLWVSDSGEWERPTGALLRIERDGRVERVLDGLAFANGLAISGGWVYVVESTAPRVVRVPVDGGDAEPVVELERVVPDGLAFDVEGGLWISCWQPNRILRLAPGGGLETIIDDWTGEYVLTPTNIAFAGPELDVLVLASLGGQDVKAIDPGVRGAPLHYPEPA